MTTDGLTDREREILAFEKTTWRFQGAKEAAIRDLFDLSPSRYHQIVRDLIDRPEAYLHDPPLVKRLRRLRDERAAAREGRATG
ncbi:MAG: hypothetical protein JWP11_497 [Frankiales bacterium]|nr:hypothetical protein [Frankiales bacterium]